MPLNYKSLAFKLNIYLYLNNTPLETLTKEMISSLKNHISSLKTLETRDPNTFYLYCFRIKIHCLYLPESRRKGSRTLIMDEYSKEAFQNLFEEIESASLKFDVNVKALEKSANDDKKQTKKFLRM